ncbi:hypothetical protein ATANTOWER_000547 [Ataeniobius toweri]|uniref:Uncharacterized protein n=1 Tax=Ataeniobius toweri TaxID=208326 RepID=A0ABU7ACD2_9TELE|nr:hypothetical protein [Ataeniobius toweri]
MDSFLLKPKDDCQTHKYTSLDTSHQEEAQGTVQDTLEGLCLSAGLGTLQASPRRAEGGVSGGGSLAISA